MTAVLCTCMCMQVQVGDRLVELNGEALDQLTSRECELASVIRVLGRVPRVVKAYIFVEYVCTG